MKILPFLLASGLLSFAQIASDPFTLSSPAFVKGGAYPVEFTCDGERASPPLAWSHPPAGTRSFAITMHHIPPGAEDKHVYMVIYNLPATTLSLPKNTRGVGAWGINTVNRQPEYTPPCSKGPGAKTYTLTAYALSSEPNLVMNGGPATMDMLLTAIKDKTLATSVVDVVFTRKGTAEEPTSPPSGNNRPGPRLPRELERALESIHMSADQEPKVQAIIQQFGEKQRQLREQLLQQLKTALDAAQYAKVEEAFRQPPGPPRE
jgi:phosphatidylethanolamine-binding protein (PEBP) family uncharacterized protein